MKRYIFQEGHLASCYFRSSVRPPHRKALLQITERCNLHCAHCFVTAGCNGQDMSIADVRNLAIPRLQACHVISVTLTGGEPFLHPDLLDMVLSFRKAGIKVSLCTNATLIEDEMIAQIKAIGGVHFNVSLDGFSKDSHGLFRGDRDSFDLTIKNMIKLGRHGLLHGVLVTPNALAKVEEYVEICDFAQQHGASYVLMNPLSSFGRGSKSADKLGAAICQMREIRNLTLPSSKSLDMVYVRFPNDENLPLLGCEAGNIIYVFTNGDTTVCPYLTFAAKTPQSLYPADEFVVGNIFTDDDIASSLDGYDIYRGISHNGCNDCHLSAQCGKGCPAAIVSSGKRIGDIDATVCPRV